MKKPMDFDPTQDGWSAHGLGWCQLDNPFIGKDETQRARWAAEWVKRSTATRLMPGDWLDPSTP